ncbi:MAG: 50S ribosomal protein L11 methyltransferase [Schleiferiaceae bacterium]|nr:50S ribosomal protein L11 methyltransferase [Schleiferiaceae bacterium]
MKYLHYSFKLTPLQPASDILIAELGDRGFESFTEREDGLDAYILADADYDTILDNLIITTFPDQEMAVERMEVAEQNWNEEWEKNFDPVIIDGVCYIRAPFHEPQPQYPLEIVMQPKMSFGTGHHPTTHLMVRLLMAIDFQEQSVIDMGCGTSLLAIVAAKRGANRIVAIDNDEWAVENSIENVARNQCPHIEVALGSVDQLKGHNASVFIANINRNILMADIQYYQKHIVPKGLLLLSGFYQEDAPMLLDEAAKYGFTLERLEERENWCALQLKRQ